MELSQSSDTFATLRTVDVGARPQELFKGMAVTVTDRLASMVTEVTTVNERIIRLRNSHTVDVISLGLCICSDRGE